MQEEPYTKREIDGIEQNITDKIQAAKDALELRMVTFETDTRSSLSRIEAQTTKTNGRVSRLERWQSYVIGFCACLSLLIVVVGVPILIELIRVGRL